MFKTKKTKVAADLSVEINNVVKSFTTVIETLSQKAQEAETLRVTKEEEIKALHQECSALSSVRDQATSIANKLSSLFS